MVSALSILAALILGSSVSALPTAECPILGPIWPPSTYDITTSDAFAQAKESFPSTIQALFDAGVIDNTTSTFALDVYSTRTNESIYSYYHTATDPSMEGILSAGVLDDQTVFRTGSVSKLHTVAAIILAGGKGLEILDEKVTKYVPELAGPEGHEVDPLKQIKWDEITVGTLANQQGGAGGPTVSLASCGCNTTTCDLDAAPNCVREFIEYLRDERHPVQPIYQTATYADAGFTVLTQVLVSMTNMTYDAAVKKYLAEPLGMNTTGTIAQEAQEANAVIYPGGFDGGSNWAVDQQTVAGSGGIYSNARDLRTLGLSILNYEVLDPKQTKEWMKPSGFTASPHKAVGAPWEIERLIFPVSAGSTRTRISDQYTKGGGQYGYAAVFLLSPDHGIGYSVLVGGPGATADRWPLRAALGEAFVPAAEWAGYEHAKRTWEGTYVDQSVEGSNITLTVRPDHPGVGLDTMFIGGIDWRANLTSLYAAPLPEAVLANLSTPMFPTGLAGSGDNGSQRLQFRAVPTNLPHVFPMTRPAAQGGQGLFDDVCSSPWGTAGFYANEQGSSIDEFVLEFDADGNIESIGYPATGARFVKTQGAGDRVAEFVMSAMEG